MRIEEDRVSRRRGAAHRGRQRFPKAGRMPRRRACKMERQVTCFREAEQRVETIEGHKDFRRRGECHAGGDARWSGK
nr:MAG TPA: hypothetical protein [Caudoviricetes sp.]